MVRRLLALDARLVGYQALSGATRLGGNMTTYQQLTGVLLATAAMAGALVGILTNL